MKNLKGKKVLITGAARGIGLETALAFAREGCTVVITDIDEQELARARQAVAQSGAEVHTFVNDVADPGQAQALCAELEERIGGIDILVNNAGIALAAELKDTTLAQWRKIIDVNIWGVVHFIHTFLPPMIARRSGHIVNISSGQAFFPVPTWGAYAATKFFVAGLSEALHYEVASHGVQVTTVFPFMVKGTSFYNEVEPRGIGKRLVLQGVIPLLGATPEKTGRIIVQAVKKGKKNELHHIGNKVGYYFMRLFPHVVEWFGLGVNWTMTRQGQRG